MNKAHSLNISSFDYTLPEDRIAKFPLANRDESKLLIYRNQEITTDTSKNIHQYLPEKALLIANNTKVIQARLFFKKPTGATIEVFCLNPVAPQDYYQMFSATKRCVWKCMIGNKKKWKDDAISLSVSMHSEVFTVYARLIDSSENLVEFTWDTEHTFGQLLETTGQMPIPPYLNRESVEQDKTTYQTVYAKLDGSVAAPTAGLHFTSTTFRQLQRKNINIKQVTLHVGAGTFQPVKETNALKHPMHAEYCVVSVEIIKALLNASGPVFAIGTTSARTLESLYWVGVELMHKKTSLTNDIQLAQFVYNNYTELPTKKEVMSFLIDQLEQFNQPTISFHTSIMITPGYNFKLLDGLITNFHQPKSTLLLLIAAIVGDNWKTIYQYALDNDFRFLSYGDSSVLFRQ